MNLKQKNLRLFSMNLFQGLLNIIQRYKHTQKLTCLPLMSSHDITLNLKNQDVGYYR